MWIFNATFFTYVRVYPSSADVYLLRLSFFPDDFRFWIYEHSRSGAAIDEKGHLPQDLVQEGCFRYVSFYFYNLSLVANHTPHSLSRRWGNQYGCDD